MRRVGNWCATFDPGDGLYDEEVGKLAESEHCTAEYQAERTSDITHQSKRRVRLFSLNVRVHQLREEYLHNNRQHLNFLGRPEQPFRTGLCFTRDVSFFSLFFSPRVLRAPSTDRPETLPHDRNLAVFYNTTPKKIGGQNMQNFGQFWTTSDFDREYLLNEERGNISKIGKTYELAKFLLRLKKKVRWTLVH